MMTLGKHCSYLSISLYLMFPGYTLLCTQYTHCYDEFEYCWYLSIALYLMYLGCTLPLVNIIMMTLGKHCWNFSISLYLMFPRYTLLCTLYTHCYDEPENTLLVLIYNIIPYKPWIHIVMMILDNHCYDDPWYTLL